MTVSSSTQPRKQRKALYTARGAERRRRMTVPLSRELRAKYHRRNLPIRKGDTVRIISGSYVGQEQRVAKVQLRDYSVTLDRVTGKTAEAKLKPLPVRPSHLVLTKLNLSDAWRRRILRVPAEEVEEEPTPSPPETTTTEEAAETEAASEEPDASEPDSPAVAEPEAPAAVPADPTPKKSRRRKTVAPEPED